MRGTSNIYLINSVTVCFLAHIFTNLKEVPIQIFLTVPTDLKTPLVQVRRKRYPEILAIMY